MNIRKSKASYLQIQLLISISIVIGIWLLYLYKGENNLNLFVLCWINNILFLLQIILLKSKIGNYLNPVILFSVFLFLFSSGQLVLYSLSIEIIDFNIFERLNPVFLQYSILYLVLGYSLYQLGVIFAIKNNNLYKDFIKMPKVEPNKNVYTIGILFFVFGFVPYFVNIINSLRIVSIQGYTAYYQEGARLSNLYTGLGYYTFTGLVLIATAGRMYQKKIAIVVLVVIAIVRLLSGDRGDGIVFIFSAYLLYIYFVQKSKPKLVQVVLLVTIMLAIVPIVGNLRHSATMDSNVSAMTILLENNIFESTLTNLGATIWPLAKIIELIPFDHEFLWGGSYISSLLLLIPSFMRIGPLSNIDQAYTGPGGWLMNYLEMSYGPGFTPFAESYMNFGWFGIVAMAGFGFFIAKLLSIRAKHNKDIPLMLGLSILSFLFLAMGARGSFNYMIAFLFRYVLIPYLLIHIVESKYNMTKK